MREKGKKGVSLVELMVGSFIVGILVILVATVMTKSLRTRRSFFLKSTVQTEMSQLMENVLQHGRLAMHCVVLRNAAAGGLGNGGLGCRMDFNIPPTTDNTDDDTLVRFIHYIDRADGGEIQNNCEPIPTENENQFTRRPCVVFTRLGFDVPANWGPAPPNPARPTAAEIAWYGAAGPEPIIYKGIDEFTFCGDVEMPAFPAPPTCGILPARISETHGRNMVPVGGPVPPPFHILCQAAGTTPKPECYRNDDGNAATVPPATLTPPQPDNVGTNTGSNRFFRVRMRALSPDFGSVGIPIPTPSGMVIQPALELQSAFYRRNPIPGFPNVAYQWGSLE